MEDKFGLEEEAPPLTQKNKNFLEEEYGIKIRFN